MKQLITLLFGIVLLTPLNAPAASYSIDPANTSIQFKVRNMGIMNVTGSFDKFKGTVNVDEANLSKSTADVSIEVVSINTGIEMRDNDLRSAGFFDAVKYPAMTFVSTKVESGPDNLKVTGNLTIKGVTKQVILVTDGPLNPKGNSRLVATAMVNRHDFGISKSAVIGDEVYITIKTEFVKH